MKYRITNMKQVTLICNAMCSLQSTNQHKVMCKSKLLTNEKRTSLLWSVYKWLFVIKFGIVTT